MSTMSLRKNRARNKDEANKKREKKKKRKRENQKKIKEIEKDNSHFFFFFACLRAISCSRIFFYKMRVLKRDRIYKIKRETNLREKKNRKNRKTTTDIYIIFTYKKKEKLNNV